MRTTIGRQGIRNSHLLSIAPAGTISLLAGNVSSGIEPVYALEAKRFIRGAGQTTREVSIEDLAFHRWRAAAHAGATPPDTFVTADAVSGLSHLAMQSSLQPFVDNAISKTITLPPDATTEAVDDIFRRAHADGIKGCTVFRPGSMRGAVMRTRDESHCCGVERECD